MLCFGYEILLVLCVLYLFLRRFFDPARNSGLLYCTRQTQLYTPRYFVILLPAKIPSCISPLPLASKTTTLHLTQSLGSTQERNQTHNSRGWQHLEQTPVIVVEEEDTLH